MLLQSAYFDDGPMQTSPSWSSALKNALIVRVGMSMHTTVDSPQIRFLCGALFLELRVDRVTKRPHFLAAAPPTDHKHNLICPFPNNRENTSGLLFPIVSSLSNKGTHKNEI